MELKEKDIKLLEILQENCKKNLKDIAREINSPLTTVYEKIKRFEKEGIIRKYTAVLDDKLLDKSLTVFVFVTIKYHFPDEQKPLSQREIARKIGLIPNVQEVHIITGDWDLLLKIKGRDMQEISSFVIDKLRAIKGVDKTFTCSCFEVVKEGTELSLAIEPKSNKR